MKKVYIKPAIIYENFSLSQSIATCDVKTNTPAQGQCGIEWGADILFYDSTGCTGDGIVFDDGGDGEHNGICYNTFTDTLFNS